MHAYSWDPTNLDLETSANKAVAAKVLHNVSLNYLLESIVMLDEDALSLKEFRKDKARWLGTYMDLEGICYQWTDASELSFTKLFTSINPDYKVVAFYYDYPDQKEKFIVWRPDTKWAPEKLEEAGYPDGIYIGQINRDGENFDVFVSNEQLFVHFTGNSSEGRQNMLSFLKQVRMLRIILYAESAAIISVLWYGIRLGEDFTRSNGFTGLDVFLFCLGNYPEKWEGAWMPDHYLIVAFPFLLLMQQLISYTDTNSRGRIYYIGFRRERGWRQAVYDGKRMLFLITSWLIFWEVTESVLFHFLYGNGRESFFLQNRITESVELFLLEG